MTYWFHDENTWNSDPRFPGIGVNVLVGRAKNPNLSVVMVRLLPKREILPHTHEVETEVAIVIMGRCRLTIGGESREIGPGMGASIPPGTEHSLQNIGDGPLILYAMHTPPTR
jgi:quercetin dioxygenase-like cupin family protein